MQNLCAECGGIFAVTAEDLAFYNHVSPLIAGEKCAIPSPTRCPSCRLQRRLAFRNQTALFLRPAYPDGQLIFSMHPATAPFPVMRNEDWASERWDGRSFGQEFSFARPFFEQFAELYARAPKYARIALMNENCEYANNLSENRNCYMIFSMSHAEDCMYCEDSWGSRDCFECTMALQCERCYDCTDCLRCYNLQNAAHCENCSDSFYLSFCRSCKHCFGCVNLRHRQYCIYNEQKTQKEYEAFLEAFQGSSWTHRLAEQQIFDRFKLEHPRPHATLRQSENCRGNYLTESRNVRDSFFIQKGERLTRCFNLYEGANDCMDYSFSGRGAELIFESCTCVIKVSRLLFCMQCRDGSSDLLYCYGCDACRDCFGCSGLRRKQYCILNKQYTKEEYEKLVPRIIEHMRATGEWGQFFPPALSPMPYNRSHAMRYFPLEREAALKLGFHWQGEDAREAKEAVEAGALPDRCPRSFQPLTVKSILSGRPFRITAPEIDRARTFHVPLPRLSYEERMDERARRLGGVRLFERTCMRTGKPLLTTYPPDSPFIIWDREEYEREFQ
jgi:hypothetical protein